MKSKRSEYEALMISLRDLEEEKKKLENQE